MDDDKYVFSVSNENPFHQGPFETCNYEKNIEVTTPPTKADCMVAPFQNDLSHFEVHCRTNATKSTNITLVSIACYQNGGTG